MKHHFINIADKDRILIIAPHPDDECIGLGGIISAYSEQCEIVVMTDGSCGIPGKSLEETRLIRRDEFLCEMNMLKNIKFHMLNFPDGHLIKYPKCFEDIDFTSYTKIFLPWHDDNHLDHTASCTYALESIIRQRAKAELYEYEVHIPFKSFTHTFDITNFIQKKVELIQIHDSQINQQDYSIQMEALAKYRACQCGYPKRYFETYCKIEPEKILQNSKRIQEYEETLKKIRMYNYLLGCWVKFLQKNGCGEFSKKLQKYGYKDVAIYGFGHIGKLLYHELEDTETHILAILDKSADSIESMHFPVQKPEDINPASIDAVIVTAVYYYEEIKNNLLRIGYKNILSLQTVLEEERRYGS